MNRVFRNVLDVENLMGILAVANVPGYLYRHYRKDVSIQGLSKRFTAEELISEYEEVVSRGRLTLVRRTVCYSLLMALTLKPYEEVKDFFDRLGDSRLEWVKEIKEIYLGRMMVTIITEKSKLPLREFETRQRSLSGLSVVELKNTLGTGK